jgi:hypothetical protein
MLTNDKEVSTTSVIKIDSELPEVKKVGEVGQQTETNDEKVQARIDSFSQSG